MSATRPLRIGITCYPSVGGSGILATALGEALASRGHSVHFIAYGRPVRLPAEHPRLHFHPVSVSDYGLFKYPDYTLPLSAKMAEVTREHGLDLLHVHYAVPHATAALLARDMLPAQLKPRVITTLHGTDTTLLGRDPAYAPAIRHALECSDAVTAVSHWLRAETQRHLQLARPIEVVHNFFTPRPLRSPGAAREAVRRSLGLSASEPLLIHTSNLRPVKRIPLLLETFSRVRTPCRLLILAGDDFAPFFPLVERLGLYDRLIVQRHADNVEEFFAAADLSLFTSESESFCLSILEGMFMGCPAVSTKVGGIPEVLPPEAGLLLDSDDPAHLASAVDELLTHASRRAAFGQAAQQHARARFTADAIVPQYESLYRRLLG